VRRLWRPAHGNNLISAELVGSDVGFLGILSTMAASKREWCARKVAVARRGVTMQSLAPLPCQIAANSLHDRLRRSWSPSFRGLVSHQDERFANQSAAQRTLLLDRQRAARIVAQAVAMPNALERILPLLLALDCELGARDRERSSTFSYTVRSRSG